MQPIVKGCESILLYSAIIISVCSSFNAVSAKHVLLRTGPVSVQPFVGARTVAKSASLSGNPAYASPSWGSFPLMQLHLVSYDEAELDVTALKIRAELGANGGLVLSYIPKSALLVAAPPSAILKMAGQLDLDVAELGPEHKIDPKLGPLLSSEHLASAPDQGAAAGLDVLPTATQSSADMLLSQLVTRRVTAGSGSAAASVLQFGLTAELLPGISSEALRAAERDWPEVMEAVLRPQPTARSSGDGAAASRGGEVAGDGDSVRGQSPAGVHQLCRPVVVAPPGSAPADGSGVLLSVFFCVQDLAAGVGWLSKQPVIKWVAPSLRTGTMDAIANILLQTGRLTDEQYDNSPDANIAYLPYWAAGLMGEGEVLGIADTGLDVDHCYFQDPRFWGVYRTALANLSSVPKTGLVSYMRIPAHRKVVQYAVLSPAADNVDLDGHGTKVAGAAAGAILKEDSEPLGQAQLDQATGAAPYARISFLDVQNLEDNGDILWVPNNADKYYLPVHRAAGAFITSDSWGSIEPGADYDVMARSFDRYLWRNPDMISLLAAGNSGTQVTARTTVASPASAKNVVAVGASYRFPANFTTATVYNVNGAALDGTPEKSPIFPEQNPSYPSLQEVMSRMGTNSLPLVVAEPFSGCRPFQNPAKVKGAVVLVAYGRCDFYTQVSNAATAGAAAVMAVQSSSTSTDYPPLRLPPGSSGNSGPILKMALSTVEHKQGSNLVGFLFEGGSLSISYRKLQLGPDSLPDFSSWGPTSDGRIKPDIVAPGAGIETAWPNVDDPTMGTCDTNRFWGTSAAAPVASGHVALMRQYLRTGFYPTGSPADLASAPFSPSGMLLKALTIAGAVSLEGGVAVSKSDVMGPAPDGVQGWGRLSLAGSLPLPGFTDPRVRLQLADWGTFTTTGESYNLSGLRTTGTGPVTVVLAYYDYPADPNAPISLVNDLDLEVADDQWTYVGNNDETSVNAVPDSRNTVERVLLRSPRAGVALSITVTATSLPSRAMDTAVPQRWAVVVVGHFTGTLQSPLNPAWVKQASLPKPPTPPPLPPKPPAPSRPIRRRRKQPRPPPPPVRTT